MFFTGWQKGFACCSHSKSKALKNLIGPENKKVLKKKKSPVSKGHYRQLTEVPMAKAKNLEQQNINKQV